MLNSKYKKIKIFFLIFLLVASSFSIIMNDKISIVKASDNYTDFEVLPSSGQFSNYSTIKISIYVTPKTGSMVDGLQVSFVNFSKNILQCTDVTKGNIINGTGYEFWLPGTIDNENGQVTDIYWSRGGSKATNPGYMFNLTFDVIGTGEAFINISGVECAYNETEVPSTVKSNSHIYFNKIILSNPYPSDNSTGLNQSEILHIDAKELDGSPVTIFWNSNVSGVWKRLGYNLSVPNGTYFESSYGIIDSPYNQNVTFTFTNHVGNTFYNNTCSGKTLGVITNVTVWTPSISTTVRPIFEGNANLTGQWYGLSSSNGYTISILNDSRAPYQWTWDSIKNIDLETSATSVFINVTYDLAYGEDVLIYWSVNATDGISWNNQTYNYKILSETPKISNPSPLDSQTSIFLNPDLSVYAEDPNGNQINVTFYVNDTGSWQQVGTTQIGYNGTYTQTNITEINNYNTTYYWMVIADDGNNNVTKIFRLYTRPIQSAPINFTANTTSTTNIQLTWTKALYSDYTIIKRRIDRYPLSNDPGILYNGTDIIFNDTALTPGLFYYYSAWAVNSTDGTWSFSPAYTQEIAKPLEPINLTVTTIDYNIINLTWVKGSGANTTAIVRKTGSYPTSRSDGITVYNGIGTNYTDTYQLGGNITYYYRAWSYSSYNTNMTYSEYSENYSQEFNTTLVGPPSILTNPPDSITDVSATLNAYLISNGGENATCGFYWGNATNQYNVTIGVKTNGDSYIYNATGLLVGSQYYVQSWAMNSYGLKTGDNITWYTTPSAPTNFTATTINDILINLSWSKGLNGVDNTVIRIKKGSYPTDPSDGLALYSDSGQSFSADGMNIGAAPTLHEYQTAGGSFDKIYGNNLSAQPITIGYNGANEYYYLNSVQLKLSRVGSPGNVTLSIRKSNSIYPYDGDIITSTIDGNIISNSSSESITFTFANPIIFSPYWQYALVVKATTGNASNYICLAKESDYGPYGGGRLCNSSDGGITWQAEYGTGQWTPHESDMVFQIYGNALLGLESNTTYYFRAWSYNQTSDQYSTYYANASNTTLTGVPRIDGWYPLNINDTSLTFIANMAFDHGEASTCGFKYGTSPGSYTHNTTVNGTYLSNQIVNQTISDLTVGTIWYYKAWTKNSAGYFEDVENSVATKPVAPTSFTATHYGSRQMNLSWTNSAGQDRTIILRKTGSYPVNMTDGSQIANTTDTSFIDRWYTVPLNESTRYYYGIWSYNNTNELYSNLYAEANDTTNPLPKLNWMQPPNNKINENTPVNLYANVSGTNPLNVSFYNAHAFDTANESLGDNAYGWSSASGVLDYVNGETWVPTGEYTGYYIYHYARVSASGYNHISTGKLTVELYMPFMVSGIYIAYSGSGSGIREWHCEYMDYYNQSAGWKSVDHNMPWGQSYYYFNETVSASAIRVWLESDDGNPNASNYIWMNPEINYITFEPPTYISSTSTMNNTTANLVWTQASTENTVYYWSTAVNNSIDIIPSSIYNVTTEYFTFNNATPISGSEVGNTYSHNCSIKINQTRGDPFNISIYTDNGSGYTLLRTFLNVYNGTYSFDYNDSSIFANTYYWKVIANDSVITHTEIYSFIIRASFTPSAPSFTATAINTTYIAITGISANGDNKTDAIMVRYNTTGYPSTPYDGTQLMNGSNASYDHRNLSPAVTYYYSAWGWDITDQIWGSRATGSAITYGPLVSFSTKTVNYTIVQLTNITGNQYTDSVMIRYKNGSYPTNMSDGIFLLNSTNTSFMHSGLTNTTIYYYSAWGYNASSNFWGTQFNKTGRTVGPITLSSPYPPNSSENISRDTTLAITLDDFDDNTSQQIYFMTNASGAWQEIGNLTNLSDGMHSILETQFSNQLTWYWWSVNATDGSYWTNATYSFKTKSIYGPSNFKAATPKIKGQINLTWNKGTDADITIIVRKDNSYPANITDGTVVYNGSAVAFNDTGLGNGSLYYYTAWSYNGSTVSIENAQIKGLTVPNMPTNITVSIEDFRHLNFTWNMGDGADKTIIVMKKDFYPENTSDGDTIFNFTSNSFELGGLKPDDYLNYFSGVPWNNTIGYLLDGGTFNYSADNNLSSKWDLPATSSGIFSYRFNISNDVKNSTINQTMDPNQRIFAFKLLVQDFYNQTGESWNSDIDEVDTFNGTWGTFWVGHINNSGSGAEWIVYENYSQNATVNCSEILFHVWTDYITPNIYEVKIGKLGYEYCFSFWSYAEKGGLNQLSIDYNTTESRTADTPGYFRPPVLHLESPANGSTLVNPHNTPFGVNATDVDGNLMDLTWQILNITTGNWTNVSYAYGVGNGTYYVYNELAYNTTYYWRVVVKDNADVDDSAFWNWTNDNISEIFNFTTRDWLNANGPTALNATLIGQRSINLTWLKGDGADTTLIRMKKLDYPSSTTDGTFVYNGSGSACNVYGLDPDITYYFKAWSWNNTDHLYGIDNATTYLPTGTNGVPIISNEQPSNGSTSIDRFLPQVNVTIQDPDGDHFNWAIFGNNLTTTSGTNAVNGTFSANRATPFPLNTMITWYVNVNDGYNWTNSTFVFSTASNTPPTITNATPTNNSVNVSVYIGNVNAYFSDPDLQPINWTLEGDYIVSTSQNGDSNGIKTASTAGALPYNTTIIWYANVTDGIAWIRKSFVLSTKQDTAPVLTNEAPTNGSTNVSLFLTNVSVKVNDANGDPMNMTIHGQYITTANYADGNGTYSANITSLPLNTTIYWFVNATDGTLWTNATYWFITANNLPPNQPTCLMPVNGTNYTSVYNGILAVNVSDPNNDTLTVSFYWSNGTFIASNTSLTSSNVGVFLPNYTTPAWLVHDTVYYWYVTVTDGMDNITGPIWNFKTSKAWDLNEDRFVNILDISILVNNIGKTCVAGSQPWDINSDGFCNILDISLLVNHIGEHYI